MEMEVMYGNKKLSDCTMIFNMGTVQDCPSRRLGLCRVPQCCYARKAELRFPNTVVPYRKRQEKAWKTLSAEELGEQLAGKIDGRKKETKYVRFNEAGDFWGQEDVQKLSKVADILKGRAVVYGYTARRDLDFRGLSDNLVINGSGFMLDNQFTAVEKSRSDEDLFGEYDAVCGGDCRVCDRCKSKQGLSIAVRKH
jgi:hypothetical protein